VTQVTLRVHLRGRPARPEGALLPIFHAVQESLGYVPKDAVTRDAAAEI